MALSLLVATTVTTDENVTAECHKKNPSHCCDGFSRIRKTLFLDREGNIVKRETEFSPKMESAIEEQLLKML